MILRLAERMERELDVPKSLNLINVHILMRNICIWMGIINIVEQSIVTRKSGSLKNICSAYLGYIRIPLAE